MNQPTLLPPRTFNPETLFSELQTAGLPIESADENGNTTYKLALTENEISLSAQVINNHSPEENKPTLSEELLNAGITVETRLEALWKAVVEQDDSEAATLQQTIAAIKARKAHETD